MSADVTFHTIAPERVARLPLGTADFATSAMWYRIYLPDLVPEADRILYLDADTVVLDDVSPLWDLDLSPYYLGAVTNVLMPQDVHRPTALGLPGPEAYFNSGVLFMNLDALRRDNCGNMLYEYAVTRTDLSSHFPDQDTLNVVLGGRRLPLAPRWNAMNSLRFPWSADVFAADELEEAHRRPAIRHFEGPGENKPWHRGCASRDRALYQRHRRATPWPRVRLEGPRLPQARLLLNRMRRRIRSYLKRRR